MNRTRLLPASLRPISLLLGAICFPLLATLSPVSASPAEGGHASGLPSTSSAINLAEDPSFESGLTPWLEPDPVQRVNLEIYPSAEAPDGKRVLVVSGGGKSGTLLSPPIFLNEAIYSISLKSRYVGPSSTEVGLEVLLMDEEKNNPVVLLETRLQPSAEWSSLIGHESLPEGPTINKGRLVLRFIDMPAEGRVEIDQLGLFSGKIPSEVSNTVVVQTFEAVELASSPGWTPATAPVGYYTDAPLSRQVLSGGARLNQGEPAEVSHTVTIPPNGGGDYRLWMRFLTTKDQSGAFTLEIEQEGRTIASEEIEVADPRFGDPWSWHWTSISGELQPGSARIILRRPNTPSAATARLIDYFLLSNLKDYRPVDADFRPDCYVRFTPDIQEGSPYCLFFVVHRPRPQYYRTLGMLAQNGFSGGYSVPSDSRLWLQNGKPSPWVRLDRDLLPNSRVRGNLLHITATRKSHQQGWVTEPFRGLLEFATGEERKVYHTVKVDQVGPRLFCSAQLTDDVYTIRTASDYLHASQQAVANLPPAEAALPEPHVEVITSLRLEAGRDDADLIAGEVAVLQRMGIYNTNTSIAPPQDAEAFQKTMGLLPIFRAEGTLRALHGSQNTPDTAGMDAHFQRAATEMQPIIEKVQRIKLMDEPKAMSYEALVASPHSQAAFREWMKNRPWSSESEPVPRLVLPKDKDRHPELFYYTGLFRLETFAKYLQAASASAHRYFPERALTYVNLSPSFARTWVDNGQDPFLIYRESDIGLLWSEDWAGNGSGIQQLSDYLAVYRAAAKPENKPIAGYAVVASAGNSTRLRLNVYQWLAAGARILHFYSYGPAYSGVDSWGSRYDLYPAVGKLAREVRNLDSDLKGLVRHPTSVAILFNRTAGIWEGAAANTEMDARYTYWALAHLGYDADFLPEEDLHTLSRYRVLYLNGVQLQQASAKAIAKWVEAGGILIGSAGAATRDEFNRSLSTLDPVFGIDKSKLEKRHSIGMPRFATRNLPKLGSFQTTKAENQESIRFDQRGLIETLHPASGATVILKTHEQKPAGVMNRFGKGRAYRWGALPGLAYFCEALEEMADRSGQEDSRLPLHYRRELAEWIAGPLMEGGIAPLATSSSPLATVTRWDDPATPSARSILYVTDFSGQPAPNFEMVIPGHFTKARSPRGTPVTLLQLPQGRVKLSFPLDIADAVVLEP